MSTVFKREWHYQYFDSCAAFEAWQAECSYERNIQSIVPVPLNINICGDCAGDPVDPCNLCPDRVLVTWWISQPGNAGGHGCSPQRG